MRTHHLNVNFLDFHSLKFVYNITEHSSTMEIFPGTHLALW